jgi:hypothetical protein
VVSLVYLENIRLCVLDPNMIARAGSGISNSDLREDICYESKHGGRVACLICVKDVNLFRSALNSSG